MFHDVDQEKSKTVSPFVLLHLTASLDTKKKEDLAVSAENHRQQEEAKKKQRGEQRRAAAPTE